MTKWNRLMLLAFCLIAMAAQGAEELFAGFFDIETGSPAGSEVVGKVHLLSNKDAHKSPVPSSCRFELSGDAANLFRIEAQRDSVGRLFGALKVAEGKSMPDVPTTYALQVLLKDGGQTRATASIEVHAVKQTLWSHFLELYKDKCTDGEFASSRLYGRTKYTDQEVAAWIRMLKANDGQFEGYRFYTTPVTDFGKAEVDKEWEAVSKQIGGLGYAYARSAVYGPGGDAEKRAELKHALYLALVAYTSRVPVAGSDVQVGGRDIGPDYGDGFARLEPILSHKVATHQWVIADALVVAGVHLMPEIMAESRAGDTLAAQVHENLIRFYQTQHSVVPNRRRLEDPGCRWGAILDTNHYSGAMADANLGHRYRAWLGMLVMWGDYNRPLTYVPYWYEGYFGDAAPPDFSFSPGWSPSGILADMQYWLNHTYARAHYFRKSGFQPDGSISHHIGKGTDASMVAYGFGWLTELFTGLEMYQNMPDSIQPEVYQFTADYLLKAYPVMIYNGWMDYAVSGRSYFSPLDKFAQHEVPNTIEYFLSLVPESVELTNRDELICFLHGLRNGTHTYSGNVPFWVNDYMVHRRGGEGEEPYFFSVKVESERTIGIEDFEKVHKSFHGGSGIFQAMVHGDEYNLARYNMDWHALPGLTEEWRTDPLPRGTEKTMPPRGGSPFAGVCSDGRYGFAAFEYRPIDAYSCAEANKACFFTETEGIALGSGIKRTREGMGEHIVTTVDQALWKTPISYLLNGRPVKQIALGRSVDLDLRIQKVSWIHQGNVGYIILPSSSGKLVLRTGAKVNVTDPDSATGDAVFHVAIDHGVDPETSGCTAAQYIMVPNVTAEEMTERSRAILNRLKIVANEPSVQAVMDTSLQMIQAAFYEAGRLSFGDNEWIEVDRPALVQLRRSETGWELVVTDPMHDPENEQLIVKISISLEPGCYSYMLSGVHPRAGETATVARKRGVTTVVVELPDHRDDKRLGYQGELYNGAPIHLRIPGLENPGE